jgi:hypothetical protein
MMEADAIKFHYDERPPPRRAPRGGFRYRLCGPEIVPPCPVRALIRGTLHGYLVFHCLGAITLFMPVSTEPEKSQKFPAFSEH